MGNFTSEPHFEALAEIFNDCLHQIQETRGKV